MKVSTSHPYKKYANGKIWKIISQGLTDLEENGDIEQKTASVYIVGYLSKLLTDANVIPTLNPPSPKSDSSFLVNGSGVKPDTSIVGKLVTKQAESKPMRTSARIRKRVTPDS